jgi:adenine-specific DNA methylase
MIERWFPCAEVSVNSTTGWGSGNSEIGLFPWFAKRPTAQAKAAVICSLLPWPDEESEQKRLQTLVQAAMTGRYAAWDELRAEVLATNPEGVSVLDPFSGRGMIPLEAARLGLQAFGVDYSPVAVLASKLLTDLPFRDWSGEPRLPYAKDSGALYDDTPRLVRDVQATLEEVDRRFTEAMALYYPVVGGTQPWGYLWAIAVPCQECGLRFPLVGSYELRRPSERRGKGGRAAVVDSGQSFYIDIDGKTGTCSTVVHDGPPQRTPTLTKVTGPDGRKLAGKSAICPFCSHVHPLEVHRRLTNERKARDMLLVVAEHADGGGKYYREPVETEIAAVKAASEALTHLPRANAFLSAVPDERIAPGNNNIIGPSIYGARTYGDFMCDRQTLAFAMLTSTINSLAEELTRECGISSSYAQALSGYAASVVARKIRRATRGCTLDISRSGIHDIYANQGSITFSQDFFEAGTGTGPGTWASLAGSSMSTLNGLMNGIKGTPVEVVRGSATSTSFRTGSVTAVVTDPPYDEMLAYADSSDLIYAWIKRALHGTWPDIAITSDEYGCQEKTEEIIVKRVRGDAPNEHRTREHYDTKIAQAFREMRRTVRDDGVVTIVFGSGDPEVWQRLLAAIQQTDLVMTGSWPANTEAGSHQGKANIETTLTMACRPASPHREPGRKGAVEAEIKAEIKRRYLDWERWGLAPADMLMAAAGPAMEVVGRYSEVRDKNGDPVDIHTFLPLARAAVQEAMALEIDHHPLNAFDARTRFALWWVRLYSRQVQAKSELRWQALASSLDIADVRDLVPDADKGVRFATAQQFKGRITAESAVIDVVLALAAASDQGLDAMADVLAASGRVADDVYLWAAVQFMARRLPERDSDSVAFARVLRTRTSIANAVEMAITTVQQRRQRQEDEDAQLRLL